MPYYDKIVLKSVASRQPLKGLRYVKQLHYSIQNLHNLLDENPVDECTAGSLRQMTEEFAFLWQAEGKVPNRIIIQN